MIPENPLQSFRFCPRCGTDGFANHGTRAKQCPACGLSYYANVASAVACLILDAQDRALFVRRAFEPAKGTLDMPGGFVDPMETIEAAVVREVKEETSLDVQDVEYLISLPNMYPYSGITVYTTDLFFIARVESFDSAVAADDAAELVIRSLDNLNPDEFGLSSIKQFISSIDNYIS